MKPGLILLKIGGGVITDKNVQYGLRDEVLSRLAREIGEAWREIGETKLIIGNGAGSFAHYSAHKYRTMEGFVNEESRLGMGWVRWDAVKLNQIVFEQLLSTNVPVFSVSPSSIMKVKGGKTIQLFMESVKTLLSIEMVPLVYGDVMVDEEKGCIVYSTERVFDELANELADNYAIRVIHVSAEEGVYDKGKASIFEKITKNNIEEVKEHLGGSNGVDVSGGMLHKVKECLVLAEKGIVSQIVSGIIPGRLRKALMGSSVKGTIIC
jgi:isopentenyl phosphate kinase